ncbi:1-deoxy-D-xylulose-5-phosphate synthase N-terminal domain-containing protein [Streptomyces sp. 8N616]|uniref:1-deoxy-D-xylulose-5-phosphate synthase N-terminal domain-containing protein n=1 Tax=Streptomyces sp. 8N616 TaxID=3457414 RepID=UPI003FD3FC2C
MTRGKAKKAKSDQRAGKRGRTVTTTSHRSFGETLPSLKKLRGLKEAQELVGLADPHDVVCDTGHQAFVDKTVTGRAARFDTLRQAGGISGYPPRAESPHDWIEQPSIHSHSAVLRGRARQGPQAASCQGPRPSRRPRRCRLSRGADRGHGV